MDSPFDTFGAVQRRRAYSQNSAFPDPGYVPDTGNIPTGPAQPNSQQELDEQSDEQGQQLVAQQAKQAQAEAAAQQKAQAQQDQIDFENEKAQAAADSKSAQAAGIVTAPTTFTAVNGKQYTQQMPTANPDGTTAYKPADLGIQEAPDGTAYRVRRNRWGAQDWSDPYQAGTNANVALNPQGQIIATPKGKGATSLPKQDVSDQGVTFGGDLTDAQGKVIRDSQGNALPGMTVAPNAAINQPQIQGDINAEEQKLVTGAAKQRIGDTVDADAADTKQKAGDAKADYGQAYAEHRDALADLKDAQAATQPSAIFTPENSGNSDKIAAAQKAAQDNLQAAQANVARTQAALLAAANARASTQTEADSAAAEAQKAKPDPLGYLEAQSDAQSQATEQANGNLPPSSGTQPATIGSPQPSAPTNLADQSVAPAYQGLTSKQISVMAPPPGFEDHHAAAVQAKAAQEQGAAITPPAVQPQPDSSGTPASTDPNSIAGLITGAYGQQPPDQTGTSPDGAPPQPAPPAEKGTWGSWLKNAATVGTADFEGSVGNIMKGIGGAMDLMDLGKSLGLYKLEEPLAKSLNTPEGFQKWKDAVEGPNLVTKAGDQIKDNATALASGIPLSVLGKRLQVDPNRTGTSVVGGIASAVPQMASGPFEVPLWMNSGYQDATDESKKAGDPWYVTQAKGIVGAVTMGGVSKLFSAFGATPAKFLNPVLFGSRQAADQTTTPLLKVLMGGATATTTDLLKRVAMLAGKGGVEGAGFSFGGQVARGDNPFTPKDASANTNEDLSSAASLAVLNSLFGGVTHGRSLAQISSGVDDLVKRVNEERATPSDGQPPQPPVDRTTVLANLIQQNQAARARQSFADLQKQFGTIDGNDSLTADQKLGSKMKATAALPAELRPAILAHLDASADAQRQVDEAMKASDAEAAKIPPANPALANRSDAYIQAHAQDITNSQQTGQPRQLDPIPTRPQGQRSQALQSALTDSDILAEAQRRQQLADLDQQRQQVTAGIAAKLKDSLDQAVTLSQTPEGRSALLELNRYNANQPAGSPKASASTVQNAMDLAPASTGSLSLPPAYIAHYLPVTHQIEQLPDPDQQTMATAAIKLSNGRALTSDEQALMLGDPTTDQPGAVDATTGKPLVSVTNGKPILTQAGLDRLKSLVPAASDVLPRNEQSQLEAQPPPLPKQSTKATKAPAPASPVAPASSAATGNGATPPPLPQPNLAHFDDETLQNRISSMQAAMANAEAHGGQFPASAKAHLAELQREAVARSARASRPAPSAGGLPSGHQVDDEVAFNRPGPEGQPVPAHGQITEVHADHYRVATPDGVEHQVPISTQAQTSAPVGGREAAVRKIVSDFRTGKADEALTRKHLANVGMSPEEIDKRLASAVKKTQPEPKQASPTKAVPKLRADALPGLDVSKIKPEHAETASLLADVYDQVRDTTKALGIKGFVPAAHPDGMIGLGIHPSDLSRIELDLPRLDSELAKLPTPQARRARIEDVIDEELRHVALETVAGDQNGKHSPTQADATFARLWASASQFQKRTAIDLYDKGALAFVDRDGANQSSHATLENASDANKGREYMRMLSQLQARGRTSEIADLLTPETKSFFQKVVAYLRHVFSRVNDPIARHLLDRTEELLQMHPKVDDDQLDMSHPDDRGSASDRTQNTADIALPNGENIPARYEVAELSDLQPSHRNGSPNPNYPAGLNERDYSLPSEKAKNEGMVASFDPRRVVTDNPDATNGPPIVDKTGLVLGGNRRTIMLSDPRAYATYKPYLQANAARFGINPDDVAKMQQPVLIRRVDTPEAQRPELIRRLNETPTGGIDTANDAVSAGKQITPDLVKAVSDLFQQDTDKTPLQHLTDGDTKSIAQELLDAGAIRPNDKEKYVTSNGNLSPEGARYVRNVLIGGILPDANLLREINDTPTQTKLLNGLSPIYTMKARGVDIAPLQEAVGLEADRQRLGIKNVVEHQAQGNLPGIGKEPSGEGKTLQSFLAGIKGNEARRAFTQLQSLVAPLEPGQTGLFGEANRKSIADLSDAEMNQVIASSKRVTKTADGLRRAEVAGAAGINESSYPGPLKVVGMPGLDPEQRRVEAKFAKWLQDDPDRAARAYAALPESEGGRVLDMDEARKLSPDYNASRHAKTLNSVSVQKVVNALTVQKLVPDALMNLRPGDTMGLTAGGPGSGKGNIRRILPAEWNSAKFVYDGVLRNFSDALNNVEDAKARGAKATIWYVHVPVEKAVDNAIGRAEHDGRALPISVLASGHFQAQQTIIKLLRHYANDPAVTIRVVDNSGSHAHVVENPLSFLQNERTLYKDADEVETRARAAFEAHAQKLTDPAAISIFRTGTVGQGLSESGGPARPASLGQRERGLGQGDDAESPGTAGSNAAERTGPAGGSATAPTGDQQRARSSSPIATGDPGIDGSGTSRPVVANPLADVPLENVRRLHDNLSKLQADGQPLNEAQKRLLAFAQNRLGGTVGGSAIRDTGTGNLFDQPAVEPARQTRADEEPLTRTQALNIYRNLSPRRRAGEALTAQASRLLERAEQTLGQTFIPGLDETASTRTGIKVPPPQVNFGKPETGIRAELRTDGADMFGVKPPGQQSLFGSGVRELPLDLPGQRDLGLGGEGERPATMLLHSPVTTSLRRYVAALHQADLGLGVAGQRPLDFDRQYQTDFGREPSSALSAQAHVIQRAEGIETTPQERFEGNLDLADRMASRFAGMPGADPDDLRQEARVALHQASQAFDPTTGVPFRGWVARVVRNRLIDQYRRQMRRAVEQATLDSAIPDRNTTAKDNIPAQESSPSQAVARGEAHAILRSAIGELPESVRRVAQGLLAGKSQVEIAREQGYKPQRANDLAMAALEKLRQSLKAKGLARNDLIGGAAVAGLPDTAVPAAKTKAAREWVEKGVQSPFFKRWFGDWESKPAQASKIVDAQGKPQVVYHHGQPNIQSFDLDHLRPADSGPAGFYFSPDPEGFSGFKKGATYQAYLDIRNPVRPDTMATAGDLRYIMSRLGAPAPEWRRHLQGVARWKQSVKENLRDLEGAPEIYETKTPFGVMKIDNRKWRAENEANLAKINSQLGWKNLPDNHQTGIPLLDFLYNGYVGRGEMLERGEGSYGDGEMHWVHSDPEHKGKTLPEKRDARMNARQVLMEMGYDGVDKRNLNLGSGHGYGDANEVIAFHPEQIKSATDNRGTFNPNDPRIVYGAGVRPVAGIDLDGQSIADARDNFDKDDVDTWPVSEDERERLRQFSGEPGDNDEFNNLSDAVDQMKENGWPEAIVKKAEQLRDEMSEQFGKGTSDLETRGTELEKYLNDPERQIAHDTDLDDTDTWPEDIKDKWDDLDLGDPSTWPAGMETDARRDGALTEEPVDEDEPDGEKNAEIDQDYAQAWMADHLVTPRVRQALSGLPDGADIENVRNGALFDSLARNEAEHRLQSSPEKNALDQATQERDTFARGLADRRGLQGYGPYISGNKLNLHEAGKGWTEHPLTEDETAQAAQLHQGYTKAWRAHDQAVDASTERIRPAMEANPPARWDDPRVADWKRDNAPEGGEEPTTPTQGTLFGTGISDEQKQRALAKFALGFDTFAKHDVAPTARRVADGTKTAGDAVLKLFAPQLRGENASSTARSLTAALAEHAQRFNQAVEWTKDAHQMFDRMSPADNHAFMDAVEQNTKMATPELEDARKLLSSINHGYVEVARSMPGNHFAAYLTHYMPHVWDLSNVAGIRKNFAEILRQRLAPDSAPGSANLELHPGTQEPVLRIGNRLQTLNTDTADGRWARDLVMAKSAEDAVQRFYQRKIQGSTAFLKHRVIPSIAEGRALGLQTVSNNPVDLYLTRWNQMGKYVAGQRMVNELKQKGIALHFADPSDVPPGWKQVDNRLGLSTETYKDEKTGKIKTRNVQLYAPGEVVDLLDNYLSPGLRNHENDLIRGGFKVINGLANVLNSAQLGFSAFHLGFTTVDAATSKLAVAMEHAAMGDLAGAAKQAALAPVQFLSPVQMLIGYAGNRLGKPEWDTHMGSKMLREYYAPGTQGSEIGQLVNAYVQGGGRAKMDPLYTDQWIKSLGKAWRQGNYPGALARLPFATLEAVMKPIMEYVVPRQKLAAFADLARLEMKKLGPNATQDDLRSAMQKAQASVDNRMGQLVYDNLHWNKTVKDLAMITTRSVGWNLGTAREILGAGVDGAKFAKNLATGQKAEFTHKMAYVAALHLLLAGMGGLAGYLLTGRRPETLTDLFFPKTGEKDANGHDVRLSFPSYVKDEAAYLHAPGTTLGNKLSPLWSSVLQVIENKDYYGTQIYGPDDNALTKAGDIAKFAGKQVVPFAWTGGNQFAKDIQPRDNVGPLRQLVGGRLIHEALSAGPTFGLTPAAKYLSTSPAEDRAQELEARLHAGETRTQAEYEKSQAKSALRTLMSQSNGDMKVIGPAIGAAIKNGYIKPGEEKKLMDDSKMSSLVRMSRDIAMEYSRKGQPQEGYAALKSIWDKATPEEQQSISGYVYSLYNSAFKVAGDKIGPPPKMKDAPKQPQDELSMAR